jgi:hypothetical protein
MFVMSEVIKTLAIPVSMLTPAAIYQGALSGSIGQSIAEVENCSIHRKSSLGQKDIRDVCLPLAISLRAANYQVTITYL